MKSLGQVEQQRWGKQLRGVTPCPATACAGTRVLAGLFVGGREDLVPGRKLRRLGRRRSARVAPDFSVQARLLLLTAGGRIDS